MRGMAWRACTRLLGTHCRCIITCELPVYSLIHVELSLCGFPNLNKKSSREFISFRSLSSTVSNVWTSVDRDSLPVDLRRLCAPEACGLASIPCAFLLRYADRRDHPDMRHAQPSAKKNISTDSKPGQVTARLRTARVKAQLQARSCSPALCSWAASASKACDHVSLLAKCAYVESIQYAP
jgi:hypothetical protein